MFFTRYHWQETDWRGRITSPAMLARFYAAMRLFPFLATRTCSWLMGSLVSATALKPLLQSSYPVGQTQPAPSLGLIISSFLIAGPYIYLFKNFIWFLVAHLPVCQGPSKWQHNCISCSAHFRITCNKVLDSLQEISRKNIIKLWWNYRKWRVSLWKLKDFCWKHETGRIWGITTGLSSWPFMGKHVKQTQIPLLCY